MKERGALVPLVLAVGAAVAYLWTLTARERELIGDLEPMTVLVASVDIPERTRLKEEYVKARAVPRRYAPPDAFEVRTKGDMRMVSSLVSRIRIPKGGAVTQSALTSFSEKSGLSVKVPPGYRGSTLPVERGLAALMKPGDRVDVVVTVDATMAAGGRRKVTLTVLQNVLVLAVGRELGGGAPDSGAAERPAFEAESVISLAVNPVEFQYLALAGETGKVGVSVRNPGDLEIHPIKLADWATLTGGG
jgi:pilus assembly protein CpaB